MTYYSYIRVSTEAQSTDRQLTQLKEFCAKENINFNNVVIVEEKRSGTNFDRPKLKKLINETMQENDCLILMEVTRAGRTYQNTRKFFETLKDRNIDFVVTNCPLLDTRKKDGNSATALVSDIVISVFCWLADQEHSDILTRTNNGRKSAKAKGVKFGRKEKTTAELPKEFLQVLEENKNVKNKTSLLDLVNGKLKRAGKKTISRGTFYNWIDLAQV